VLILCKRLPSAMREERKGRRRDERSAAKYAMRFLCATRNFSLFVVAVAHWQMQQLVFIIEIIAESRHNYILMPHCCCALVVVVFISFLLFFISLIIFIVALV